MYKLCLAALLALSVPSLANAGGGGSKELGKIRITNNTNNVAYVAVDPSAALLNANQNNFTSLGGRILNAGESTEFKNLKDGSHTVIGAVLPTGTVPTPANFDSLTRTTRKGVTTNVNASEF